MQVKKQLLEQGMEQHWFEIGKGARQGCILSPCLFNLYAEYSAYSARLDDSQAGIKIAKRNINNLRCANDTIPMAESEEELKSLLMRAKEESEKAGLKLNIQRTKIMSSSQIQFSSVTQSCLTLWDTKDCSTPGFPVHHQVLEPAQTHVHQVCDA